MTERAYNWDAAGYADHSAVHFGWARELIDRLNLQANEYVLDIGCGDGKITAALAARLPDGRALGVDRSPAMVALARQRFGANGPARLSFCQMDATRLGCAPVFDVAFSTAALHWVRDHQAVLAGVRDSLKPGGRVMFQMGGAGNVRQMIEAANEVMAQPRWSGYFRDFVFPYTFPDAERYRPLLAEAGLQARRVELVPKDMPHADVESIVKWLRTAWHPYHEPVPAELKEAFIAEVAKTYAARHPAGADGQFHVAMVRLEVEAVRV